MPELHKNQIEWNAPEPRKVSLDAVDLTPVADGLKRLGRAADEFSRYKAQIDDIDAMEKMKLSTADMLAKLEKKQPTDNDFNEALDNFNTGLKQQFDTFDEATRNRFMRDNPTFFDEQNLKAEEIVFDKQQKFAITKAKNVIPLLASNVTEGVSSYDTERKKLDDMVAGMDSVSAEELYNYFDRQVQVGNLYNHIKNGAFSDALYMIEHPKESDQLTPEERTRWKTEIQNMLDNSAKSSAEQREKALKEYNDGLEKNLTMTLLYLFDIDAEKGTQRYGEMITALDKGKDIDLLDNNGKVVGKINAKDIPVTVRRDAIKNSREYRRDTEAWRLNTFKANTLADNLKTLYQQNYKKRPTNEIFNDVYAFTQSADFIYLDDKKQQEMYDIVYGEVARTNEQVIPYSGIRDQRLLYGDTVEYAQPSGPAKLRQYVFGPEGVKNAQIDKFVREHPESPMMASVLLSGKVSPQLNVIQKTNDGTDWETNKKLGYREATLNLKKQYEKQTGNKVRDGSALEFLMNTYANLLALTQDEREIVGLPNATDSQIGLTYNRLLGWLEQTGQASIIIGQNMSKEDAESIRKEMFNGFYDALYNNSTPTLEKEQVENKNNLYSSIAEGSYGTGAKVWHYERKPEYNQPAQMSKHYSNTLTNAYIKQIDKENK